MLVRLLYASRAQQPVTGELLESLMTTARKNNASHGITGVLCHTDRVFMQLLEGGRDDVSSLYHRIAADSRHSQVTLLQYVETTERHFFNWSMGQVNLERVNPSLLLKYAPRAELDPFSMSGSSAMKLLDELIATAAVVGRCS